MTTTDQTTGASEPISNRTNENAMALRKLLLRAWAEESLGPAVNMYSAIFPQYENDIRQYAAVLQEEDRIIDAAAEEAFSPDALPPDSHAAPAAVAEAGFVCPKCSSTDFMESECRTCHGLGYYSVSSGWEFYAEDCANCESSGVRVECLDCDWRGGKVVGDV